MSRLRHVGRYFGIFTNSKKKEREAYIEWSNEKNGFLLKDAEKNQQLLPEAYTTVADMKRAGVNFVMSKRSPDLKETIVSVA